MYSELEIVERQVNLMRDLIRLDQNVDYRMVDVGIQDIFDSIYESKLQEV